MTIERRQGRSGTLILVIVEGNGDADALRLRLKDAGYEAFPL